MKNRLVVVGLGRCGMSLTMQMLDAGGVPVLGEFPAYEEVMIDGYRKAVEDGAGRAIKLVMPNPHLNPILKDIPDVLAIVLSRNPTEQAKSQRKLANVIMGRTIIKNADVPRMAAANARDQGWLIDEARRLCVDVLTLDFELIIRAPRTMAERISKFVGGIDIDKAWAVVKHRGVECYDGMLEEELLKS